ncbi:hypothetical protein HYW73_03070 [Candidatus Nomurabacteria bacterium]|nr:hypothetical protein [Candidatus Nomurabacteria bacterium]
MKAIPREAGRITYSTNIRKLKLLHLSDIQKAVVIGSILGDGNLNSNWSRTNYRLKISHSVKQSDYLLWKYEVLKDFVLTKPNVYEKTKSISFRTISHNELTQFYKLFYPLGKKVIPRNIKELINNPLTMAIWFMDDGNAIKRKSILCGYHLNSQSFTLSENKLLSECLYTLYKIESVVELNNNNYRLAIWKQDSRRKFRDLVTSYVIDSMKYKIG